MASKNEIRFLRLSCAVQTYSWGKIGQDSEVAKLKLGDPTFTLKDDVPYAEVKSQIYTTLVTFSLPFPLSLHDKELFYYNQTFRFYISH